MPDPRISLVIVTRNRRESLLAVLARAHALPERPRVIVVDNASTDGTPAAVRRAWPGTLVVALAKNGGGAARNAGVLAADTPYVAFCDDDSWWEPGALARVADAFDRSPRLAVVAGRIVLPDGRTDPVCARMAGSPLSDGDGLPGPRVLGFVACAAAVRRSAFLAVGGFSATLGFVGEERLLAVDLAEAGWALAYMPDAVAHHRPDTRDEDARRRLAARNELWFAWLRRPAASAVAATAALGRRSLGDPAARAGMGDGVRGLARVLRERRPASARVERDIRAVTGR